MKNAISVSIICFIGLIVGTSSVWMTTSNGAPIASTGAPRDMTCAKSGCHEGSVINIGPGNLHLNFNQGELIYEAGKTYPITIEMKQTDIHSFGFQMVAIHDIDTTNAGTIQVTDSLKTQVLKGVKQNADRRYITYKYLGTAQVENGLGRWTFNWTAPAKSNGNITFYYGGIAANNDGTDSGDWVYHQKTTISPAN